MNLPLVMSPSATLLFFTILMVIFPLSTFFILKTLLVAFVEQQQTALIVAAVGAVLAVHTVVFLFVYKAYHEKDDGPIEKEKVPQKID